MKKQFMGIDQYGTTYHNLTKPRKDLLNRLDRKHCEKMYQDDLIGGFTHIGYIIAGLWITIYELKL